jgi:hypothetical protein
MNLITSALVFALAHRGIGVASFSLLPGGADHPLHAPPCFAAGDETSSIRAAA